MLRLTAEPDGTIGFVLTVPPGADLTPAGPHELDIDEAANPDFPAAWDTDSRSFALIDGELTRNGEPYAVNPPSPPEPTQAERIAAALVSLPELSDHSKAALIAALSGG
jgi:hypothetical protein